MYIFQSKTNKSVSCSTTPSHAKDGCEGTVASGVNWGLRHSFGAAESHKMSSCNPHRSSKAFANR